MADIINSEVTYKKLIDSAAKSIYDQAAANQSVGTGVFKTTTKSITIGKGVTNDAKVDQGKTATLKEVESRTAAYTTPTLAKITTDLTAFMTRSGIPVGDTVPSSSGIISFFYALNFFVEKAFIYKNYTGEESGVKYHRHYTTPTNAYTAIKVGVQGDNRITQSRISDIYNQVRTTSQIFDGPRATSVSSSAHTSSSCSSSCSSSSFIAYFNID